VSQNGLDSEGYPAITNRPSDRSGGETGVLLGSSGLYVHSIRSVLTCQGVAQKQSGSSRYRMRYTIRLTTCPWPDLSCSGRLYMTT